MSVKGKFHISKDGVARKCQATKQECKLGISEDEHFTTKEEAQKYYEQQQERSKFHLKGSSKKREKFTKPIMIEPLNENDLNFERTVLESRLIAEADLTIDEATIIGEYFEIIAKGEIPEEIPENIKNKTAMKLDSVLTHFGLIDNSYYARVTKKFARKLVENLPDDSVLLDPFAGKGYLAKALRENGVETIASDDYSWKSNDGIEKLDFIDSLDKYGDKITHVVISWTPPESNLDVQVFKKLKKDYPHVIPIYIGEPGSGLTGDSDTFWDHVEIDREIDGYDTFFVQDGAYFLKLKD